MPRECVTRRLNCPGRERERERWYWPHRGNAFARLDTVVVAFVSRRHAALARVNVVKPPPPRAPRRRAGAESKESKAAASVQV